MSFMAAPSDETLRGRWKWFVGIGIVLVIVGLIALANVVDATLITKVIVGIALVFGGVMQLIGAWAAEGSTGRRALMRNLGVLYITHDLATARHFSDEIMVLYRGEVVERGPADDVILNPQHEYTRLLADAAPDPERRLAELKR